MADIDNVNDQFDPYTEHYNKFNDNPDRVVPPSCKLVTKPFNGYIAK